MNHSCNIIVISCYIRQRNLFGDSWRSLPRTGVTFEPLRAEENQVISFHILSWPLWPLISLMISYHQWRFMTFSGFVLSCFINLAVFPFSIPHGVRQPVWKSTGFTMLQALLWTIVQLKRLSLTAGIAQLEESVECSKQVYVEYVVQVSVSSLY